VSDYIEDFSNLARYTPEDVDTDAKRKERFLDGLNDELAVQLSVVHVPDFQTLMDKARVLEGKRNQAENRKRKHNHNNHNSLADQRVRTHHDGNGNSEHREHGVNIHDDQNHHSRRGNGQNNGDNNCQNRYINNTSKRDIRQVQCYQCKELGHYSWDCPEGKDDVGHHNRSDKRDMSKLECFKCRKLGHYSWDCPENNNGVGNSNENNPIPLQKGHLNHVNVEEVFEVQNAATRKFDQLLPTLLPFNTGTFYTFISRIIKNRSNIDPIKVISLESDME
jgi:hypothetical protein